ncbi:MAG: hypothetical protein ABI237_09880 [Ginsengibacter sp.]
MGGAGYYLNLFCSFTPADWITLFGILVNAGLAYWIVRTIQNRLTNKRVLKDHFINEVKEIRNEYKTCLNNLYSNSTHPRRIIPWFKLMNIKIEDLMEIIHSKYCIDKNKLRPYQIEFQELITNNTDFITHYNNEKVIFTEVSRSQFIKFQQSHNHIFNDVIIKINDAK